MTNIKTYEDACAALKMNPETLPAVEGLPEKHQKSITAYFKLIIIAEALNEGWAPDWKDHDQLKYYPWFYMDNENKNTSPGVGFSYHVCGYVGLSASGVGSRLCFKTEDLAEYAGQQFTELYKEYMFLI